MQIVIEYVLLDNFLIDALLLILSQKTLRQPIFKSGIICASAFGAGFAVVSPLIPFGGIWAVLLKFSVALVMSFMVCFSFKKIFLRFLVFSLYTFAFGGALIAIFSFMNVQVYDAMYIGYVSTIPLGTLLVCGIVFFVGVFRLIISIAKRKEWERAVDFGITILGKTKKFRGFVDTGNSLKNSRGLAVVVLAEKELSYWFNTHERMLIMLGKTKNLGLENAEFIVVSSLGGSYKMLVFDCVVSLNGVEQKACVGVSNSKIHCGDCTAIVGTNLLEVAKC